MLVVRVDEQKFTTAYLRVYCTSILKTGAVFFGGLGLPTTTSTSLGHRESRAVSSKWSRAPRVFDSSLGRASLETVVRFFFLRFAAAELQHRLSTMIARDVVRSPLGGDFFFARVHHVGSDSTRVPGLFDRLCSRVCGMRFAIPKMIPIASHVSNEPESRAFSPNSS